MQEEQTMMACALLILAVLVISVITLLKIGKKSCSKTENFLGNRVGIPYMCTDDSTCKKVDPNLVCTNGKCAGMACGTNNDCMNSTVFSKCFQGKCSATQCGDKDIVCSDNKHYCVNGGCTT
jgi:hypothetical protein